MGEVLKLGRFRKRKAREDKQRRAEANRAKHGRTKAEKQAAQRERERLRARVDGARMPGDEGEDAGEEVASAGSRRREGDEPG